MKIVKAILLLALSLAFWSATFAMIGYAFLSIAPCHWFGSSFEGTCGYRGIFFTVVIGAFLSIGMSIYTVISYLSSPNISHAEGSSATSAHP